MHYKVPNTWELNEESSSNTEVDGWAAQKFYNCPSGGCMSIAMAGGQNFPEDLDGYVKNTLWKSSDENRYENITKGSLGEATTYTSNWHATRDDVKYQGKSHLVFSGYGIYVVNIIVPKDAYSTYEDLIGEMLSSVQLSSATAVITGGDSNATKTVTPSSDEKSEQGQSTQPTTSQKNALNKAKSYLKTSNFSYDGLVEQLEYEKYSHDDAVYAVDNCGANWNSQAAGKAKRYLSSSAFSYAGLIEQLEYEGFSEDQATYGADNCGGDWMAQAAKKAERYMKYSSFSRSSLIDQLLYEGFTDEQAEYGADSVGL